MQINVEEALKTLRERPIKATSYERVELMQDLFDKYPDVGPQAVRFARLLREFLRKVTIPMESYDLFPGRITVKELNSEEEENFQQFIRGKKNPYHVVVFGSGHRGYDWENLVKNGISGLRQQINQSVIYVTDEEKRYFLMGIDLLLDAIREFILRYADKSAEVGATEVETALRNIACSAPKTFYEALLLCWIVCFIDASYVTHNPTLMIGRLDKILYPFFEADLKSGALSEEKAKEIILDFYCKHNLNMGRGEHQMGNAENMTTFERILNFDAPQYLELCGKDEKGDPCVNRLTELFVECMQPGLKNPVLMVRYFKGMNKQYPKAWKLICQKALQSCSIITYNDDDVIKAYTEIGVPIEDAREYEHFGCNWCHLGINSYPTFMNPPMRSTYKEMKDDEYRDYIEKIHGLDSDILIGLPLEVMKTIEAIAISGEEPKSIDEVYDAVYRDFCDYYERKIALVEYEMNIRYTKGKPVLVYGDCINRHVLKNANSSSTSGVKYHPLIFGVVGFANIADSLGAIEKLVFIDKKLTLKEFYEIVKNNYEGHEKILALAKKVEKFGSGGRFSTSHGVRVANMIAGSMQNANKKVGFRYGLHMMPSLECDTTHLKRGKLCGATFDGRRAGEPFAQNSNPTIGANKGGIVGLFGAMQQLPLNRFNSGALNVDVNPKDYEGEEGLNIFSQILGEYFNSGGLHAQISAVSVDDLKDAQINPQNHGDLLVRVTGYSGIFVDIGKKLQDNIIRRMEN